MCPSLLSFPRLTLFLQHTFDFPRISNAKAKHQHFLSFELGRIELSPIPTDRFSSSSRRSIEARLAFHPISSVLPSSSRFSSLFFLPRWISIILPNFRYYFLSGLDFVKRKIIRGFVTYTLTNASQPREDRICAA